MKVDIEGNVCCGGSGGIWVMDPHGKHLDTIVPGAPGATSMAWGGEDWKTLYFTTRHTLGSLQMKIPGVAVPAKMIAALACCRVYSQLLTVEGRAPDLS